MDSEKLLKSQNKNADEIQVNQSINQSLNQSVNENLVIQNGQENLQSGLMAQINIAMPPVMEQAEVQNLQANQQEVAERTEIERNMPASHTSISGARQRIAESGRSKNSEKMTLVLEKTDMLLKQLEYTALSPCTDEEFGENLAEVKRNYDELITACRMYVKAAKKPRTKPGVRRLNIVKDILLQAESERMLLTDSATRLRNLNKADEHIILTFDNVLENMVATSADAAGAELMEADDMSKQLVIASKLADGVGAQDTLPSAEMKAFRTDNGLENFVSVKKNEVPEDRNLAEKKQNTGNIIKAIATNATSKAMADLLASIKQSEAKADKDVLNNLLTANVEDLIMTFGSVYTEDAAKAFRDSMNIFKKELVKSGLDKDLELYALGKNDEVTVSLFTSEEKAKQSEKKNIPIPENEKNGLLKEGDYHNTIGHVLQEPILTREAKELDAKWVDQKDKPLFEHEPNINDIVQGKLGDCYFLAALGNVVMSSSDVIKEMMRDNGDGTVTVRFYEFDSKAEEKLAPVYVKVKKSIPKVGEQDMYARGCLWVQLLEKAFVCSGLARDMQELYEKMDRGDIRHDESVDFRNYKIYSKLKAIKAQGMTEEEMHGDPYLVSRQEYEHLDAGGVAQAMIPLLTGKFMKDMNVEKGNLYWNDLKYADANDEIDFYRKVDLNGTAKFSNFLKGSDKDADEYVISLMKQHDDVKQAEVDEKNKEVDAFNAEVQERIDKLKRENSEEEFKKKYYNMSRSELRNLGLLRKERNQFRARDQRASYANNEERARGKYYMYTGNKMDDETAGKEETKAKMEVCDQFAEGFVRYADTKFDLSVINTKAEKAFLKILRDYKKEFVDNETDEKKKTLRRDFLGSDDYLKVCRWLKKKLQRPKDQNTARYTAFSGNYYGQALDVYETIKGAVAENKTVTTGLGYKLEMAEARRRGIKKRGRYGEADTGGIYAKHAYSVIGVSERKFGGKTYKFVVLRNPWGWSGTEYFYNAKTKKLDRRTAANKDDTNGYTMIELSEYMLYAQNAFVQDTVGIGGKPQ